jgi:putative SOS response-associated peptidase YedK
MCGRYSMTKSGDGVALRVRVKPLALAPRYNIAPTQMAPVILIDKEPAMKLLRWGLVPSWAEDESVGARLINARAETLQEKPAFRQAFARQRCLVLADGYYEWQGKQPYRFTLDDERPFAFAGLWEKWQRPDGSALLSFAIVTTEPNELTAAVHDRMPVILRGEDYEQWLEPGFGNVEQLRGKLRPYAAAEMAFYAVDPIMNSPNFDDPRCIMRHRETGFLPGLEG